MAKRTIVSQSPPAKRAHLDKDGAAAYQASVTDTWIACGSCANTLGLTVAAIKAYESAVAHDAASAKAICGLSYSLRLNDINLNETVGSLTSIERLNKALESYPALAKDAAVFKELAECYLLIGLNDQAHQAIQTAIQLTPNDASLWLLSAQTLIRAGARTHAAGSLTHCLQMLPESLNQFSSTDIETARAAHAELAAIATADGNIELSIAELTATLSLPPPPLSRIDEHIALWCALATVKERANDIPGAIQACESAEIAVGNSPRILMTHAYLLLLNNDKSAAEHAIFLLSKIIDLEKEKDAESPDTDGDFLPWYLMGKAYSLVDQPRLAYDSYQVALRRASNSPITWLAVGKLYLQLKQLSDALAAYSQALRLQIDEGSPGTATAWDGLSCVYERCDDQLMDASDACARSAACFKAVGDIKNASYFEDRADTLVKASKKEGPVPSLRDPPDVPSFLLRDLVALLPAERIAFIQGPQQPPTQSHTPASAPSQPQQPPQHQPPQVPTPQQQPPPPQPLHQRQQSAQHTPVPQHQQSPAIPVIMPQQTPQQPSSQHYPQQHTPQQHVYPMPYKQEHKSPRQAPIPPQLPHPPQQGWSPNQQPQYFYQPGPPPPPGQLPPPHHQPPPEGQGAPHRSPLNHPQMVANGNHYPVGPPGPPPPGYAYSQYVPMQGGVVTHMQQPYAPPINNWRR